MRKWLFGIATLVVSCTIWNGLTVPEKLNKNPPNPGAGGDPCDHAYVLEQSADNPTDTFPTQYSFTSVMKSVEFGTSADAGTPDSGAEFFGFDLDNTCSGCGSTAKSSCRSQNQACDDRRGRDNGSAFLINSVFGNIGLDLNAQADDNFAKGRLNVIFYVDSYNGQADDPDVGLSVIVSLGIRAETADGGLADKATPATFTVADQWIAPASEVRRPGNALLPKQRTRAFVRNHQLVAKVQSIVVNLGGLEVNLQSVVLQGTITGDPQKGFLLSEAQLGGRWPANTALSSARRADFGGSFPPFCEAQGGDAIFSSIRDQFCAVVDIMADEAKDNKDQDCDAIATSIRFVGAPGSIGRIVEVPSGLACAPNPELESCPQTRDQ